MSKLPKKLEIDKKIGELTDTEILVICYDSYSCNECPLYVYDVALCLDKYKKIRENCKVHIKGLFRTDKD